MAECCSQALSQQAAEEATHAALAAVAMQGFAYQPTSSLSGGQKQRVTIAGALAQKAQVHGCGFLGLGAQGSRARARNQRF